MDAERLLTLHIAAFVGVCNDLVALSTTCRITFGIVEPYRDAVNNGKVIAQLRLLAEETGGE